MATIKVNNKFYRKLEDRFRREFVLQKQKSIQTIANKYAGAVHYVADVLESFPQSYVNSQRKEVLNKLDQTIISTYPTIASSFRNELLGISQLAVTSVAIPLSVANLKTSKVTQQRFDALPDVIVNETFNTQRYSDQRSLSERIWSPEKRVDILKVVDDGFNDGLSPAEIADNLKEYSMSGNGFNDAFRLAYNELTGDYAQSKVEGARAWNEDPDAMFTIAIEQYVSPTHKIEDECDALAGIYRLDEPIPAIPRHIGCNCGQRQVRLDEVSEHDISSWVSSDYADSAQDYSTLQELGVPVTAEEQTQAGVGTQGGVKVGSTNKYNKMFEVASRLPGDKATKALQALANVVDPADPQGPAILNTIQSFYGITPQTESTPHTVASF